jgi:NTE family protein
MTPHPSRPTNVDGVTALGGHPLNPGPRVAVALGGGGARGYAHIGILEVLREHGYDVVSIAGSSMGALTGGLFAAGGLDAYSDWVRGLTQRDVLRLYDPSPRAPGAIRAEKIFARVSDILGDARIEDLPIPFTAVATDLVTGEERWFQDGPVDAAIRASAALPGFMTPVVIDGRLLADGVLTNPLPIVPTMGSGADLTVAVVVSGSRHATAPGVPRRRGRPGTFRRAIGPRLAALRGAAQERADSAPATELPVAGFDELPPHLRLRDVMDLSLEAVRTSAVRHTLAACPPDVLITIQRSSCRTLDFHKAEEMIALGRGLAVEALAQVEGVVPARSGAPT